MAVRLPLRRMMGVGASTSLLSACLGPLDPGYVDEVGVGGRTVALYLRPWHPGQKSCLRTAGGPVRVATQKVASDGHFEFASLKAGCYEVADVTELQPGQAPSDKSAQPFGAAWIQSRPEPVSLTGKTTRKDHGGAVLVRICHGNGAPTDKIACR